MEKPAAPVSAAMTGRDVMEKVINRDNGDHKTADMEMVLIDKNGSKRTRKIQAYSREFDEGRYSILFFLEPADVKNTGFLTLDYKEAKKDDDQWLYLPALRKTKRIAGSDQSGSFMGSDFNYSDMTEADIDGLQLFRFSKHPKLAPKIIAMKSEIAKYNSLVKALKPRPQRLDAKGKDTFTLLGFWRANEDEIPAFSFLLRAVLANAPN